VTTSLTKPYDSIVIGAGHNGLVCATLLARVGQRVLLLEAGERVGGLAADREFHPGFHAPVANTLYALPTTVIRDLRLADYGFEMPVDTLPLVALSPDETPTTITGAGLRGASAADTAAYGAYVAQLQTFHKALAPFWGKTMPRIGDRDLQSLLTFAHVGAKLRLLGRDDMLEFFRVATLPMRDLVDEHFESEALKAALCWDGLVGSKMAPALAEPGGADAPEPHGRGPRRTARGARRGHGRLRGGAESCGAGRRRGAAHRDPPWRACASTATRTASAAAASNWRAARSSGPRAWCPAPTRKPRS
jgi:choline dehydrogenase-like flavoprotein